MEAAEAAAEAATGAAAGERSCGVLRGWKEGELGEDPGGAMVFGSPNDEQRGRGTRTNGYEEEEETTSAENAGLIARRKSEREVEKRRAGTTEGGRGLRGKY
ncbi:hypothetical protein CesoFtcFv8_000086 [Champsocephalus esox]|uniref:Uncharacterized protein n=1 Tax=Champsocephalus esox TaxID=159716 RepID=A0AAN8E0H4_9TELE|nr:hypothetical protein CesoFtcFv8_000086 [Champsocephalus esox]